MTSTLTTRIGTLGGESDYRRVRAFLVATHRLFARKLNWETRRWDGWFWYRTDAELADPASWLRLVGLWDDGSGELVGAMIPEGQARDLCPQIHPDHRHLEDGMYAWAERHLAPVCADGIRHARTRVFDFDHARSAVVARRGYRRTERLGFARRRTVAAPIPEAPVPAGYRVRSLRRDDPDDGDRWADAVRAVFPHVGEESRQGERNLRIHGPAFDHDLHLVAEDGTGGFAAFAGLTVDAANRFAQFEPVGTHPAHLRRGLARAVMAEGLRRLRARGDVDMVYVATGSAAAANGLYVAMGFIDHDVERLWEKAW